MVNIILKEHYSERNFSKPVNDFFDNPKYIKLSFFQSAWQAILKIDMFEIRHSHTECQELIQIILKEAKLANRILIPKILYLLGNKLKSRNILTGAVSYAPSLPSPLCTLKTTG